VTGALIGTLCLVTATVNMRFVLISASLQPWLTGLPARQIYPARHFAPLSVQFCAER